MKWMEFVVYLIPALLLAPSVILRFSTIEPVKRGYFCDDETIKYPYVEQQTVPTYLCLVLWIISCLLTFTIVFLSHKSWKMLGDGFYKLMLGFCLCLLFTDVCKFSIGRLRPYFITICKPYLHDVCYDDEVIYTSDNETYYGDYYYQKYVVGDTCTDNKDLLKEARLSFVSGHSSISFYIAMFLIIFMKKYVNIRILRYLLQVGNFILALWISLSRLSDYMHHSEDVIMGSILGVLCVFIVIYDENFVESKMNTNSGVIYHKTNISLVENKDDK